VVELGLFVDELLELFNFQTVELEVEVKSSDGLTSRLVVFLVELGHVWVIQSALDGDSLDGVELKHLLEQVDGIWVLALFEHGLEVLSWLTRKLLHELLVVSILDLTDKLVPWRATDANDHLHLFSAVRSWH